MHLHWLLMHSALHAAVDIKGASNVRFLNCQLGVNFADEMGGAGAWPREIARMMHCFLAAGCGQCSG